MIRGLLLVLLLAACGGGGARPAPAPRPTPVTVPKTFPIVGINSHGLTYQDINLIGALRVRYVRHSLYVDVWEGSLPYRETFTDGLALAFAHDRRILLVVHQVPKEWTPEAFAAWMGERAHQFGPLVESYQLGNEWSTLPGSLPADEYSRWFNLAADQIRRSNPVAKVVTVAIPNPEYARALVQDRIQPDAWALHLYDGLATKTREMRRWLPADAVVWATEFGTANEATKLAEWQACIQNADGYARLYGYALVTPHETHGIYRKDGTPTPTAEFVRTRGWAG